MSAAAETTTENAAEAAAEAIAGSLPLTGVRVVSLAVNLPGPVAAARFAALGAHVTKVEPPSGDPLKGFVEDWYRELAAGQDVVVLDLKQPRGREQLFELLADADLLLTSHRVAALERLGLAWGELHARLPRLCQVAVIGHPAPHDDVPGHDLTYQAAAGTLVPPTMPTVLVADLAGAERTVSEGLAALVARAAHGAGTRREVALSVVGEDMSQPARHGLTTPDGLLGGALATYGIYAAAQGHVALAALEPHFAAHLTELLGCGSRAELEAVFATRTATQWDQWARQNGVPLAAVRSPSDVR